MWGPALSSQLPRSTEELSTALRETVENPENL